MALKLRRGAFTFTNRWPPQKEGVVSFKRMLGGACTVATASWLVNAFCRLGSRTMVERRPRVAKRVFAAIDHADTIVSDVGDALGKSARRLVATSHDTIGGEKAE